MGTAKHPLLLLIFCWVAVAINTFCYEFELFNFGEGNIMNEEEPLHQWTLTELVKESIERGLDTREKLLDFYLARKVNHAEGMHLLPELNVIATIGAGMERAATLESIVPLVGFLLPSRWFNFHSTRHLKKAEKEGLITVMANSAKNIQMLYLDILRQTWLITIAEFYCNKIDELVDFFQQERQRGIRRLNDDDLAVLENIKGKILYDRAFVDALSASYPKLATAIGRSPKLDWSTMHIEPLPMPLLFEGQKKKYSEYVTTAFQRSSELRIIDELILAAKHHKRGVYFDPIDPDSGNNVGLAIAPRIKICRANIALLVNRRLKTEMEIGNAIQDEINNYNDAVESLPALNLSLKSLFIMKEGMQRQINDPNATIDFNELVRLINYAKGAAVRYVNAYFTLVRADAALDRLVWRGEVYNIVNDYRFYEIPNLMKKIRRELSWRGTIKNKLKRAHFRLMRLKQHLQCNHPPSPAANETQTPSTK